jgi:hypothetical protein
MTRAAAWVLIAAVEYADLSNSTEAPLSGGIRAHFGDGDEIF